MRFPIELETVDRKLTALTYLEQREQAASDQLEKYCQLKITKWYEQTQTSSLEILRQAVETSFDFSETPLLGPFVQKLREESEFGEAQFSDLQIKSLILSLYIAGSETTSLVLNCLLYQLAHHPEYQDAILREVKDQEGSLLEIAKRSPAVNQLFAESMRLFSPVSEIVRIAAQDLVCTAKNEEHNEIYRKTIPKGTTLIYQPAIAGESLYQDPAKFDPSRPELSSDDLPWLPFGYGKHVCPGQSLARTEILGFVTALVQKYKILPVTKDPPELEEGFTTRTVRGDIFIRLDRCDS